VFNILPNGAILIGNNFTVDGHWSRPFRIITHFHADHIMELDKSIRDCSGIIATPITLEILNVLGYKIPKFKEIPLNYDTKIMIEDERLTLIKSEHVIGSAQVLIKLSDSIQIGYTGDFKNPGKGTPILNPDILIIEATYGKPNFRRRFKEDLELLFPDYVKDALVKGPVRIYGYHGKLQEIMSKLRNYGIDAPFIVEGKVEEVTKIAIKYGFQISNIFSTKNPETSEIVKSGWFISFHHFLEFKRKQNGNKRFTDFLVSGWEFKEPIRRLDENSYIVALSDHADFDELIYYIDNSGAELIVTDGGRKSYAKELAEYVNKYLGKRAVALP
jgi:putative mRNA 3-end processing factor